MTGGHLFVDPVRSGLVQNGRIRHLPPGVYWEKGRPRDTYQNGGYQQS